MSRNFTLKNFDFSWALSSKFHLAKNNQFKSKLRISNCQKSKIFSVFLGSKDRLNTPFETFLNPFLLNVDILQILHIITISVMNFSSLSPMVNENCPGEIKPIKKYKYPRNNYFFQYLSIVPFKTMLLFELLTISLTVKCTRFVSL